MSSVAGGTEQTAPRPARRSTVTGLAPAVQSGGNPGPRTSIVSILNARRFTRNFTSRLLFRNRTSSGLSVVSNQPQIRVEPTYRTEPRRKFLTTMATDSIEKIVQKHIKGRQYNPAKGQLLAKVLAEEVKQDVKSLGFERFKVAVHAVVGEKASTAVQVASRTLCDVNHDSHVTVNCETDTMFAAVTAYAFYRD